MHRASSRFIALRIALRRASHPGGGIPEGAPRRGHPEGDRADEMGERGEGGGMIAHPSLHKR